jgi:hypothetical protein
MEWLMLVASLSGQQSALRIRVWRALKASGAAPLRDGVYVVPAAPEQAKALEEQRSEVLAAGGAAYLLPLSRVSAEDEASFAALFDRSEEYSSFQRSLVEFVETLPERTETDARRALRQLKRDLAGLEAVDFFPGTARTDAANDLREAEAALMRTFSPEEPASIRAAIPTRNPADYRSRTWATREHLWVDRVASAWLIRRFVDPDARFLWLRRPSDCPRTAVGFDFDGAEFTHVEDRVTYEVLVESFGFAGDAALTRLGALVRALDVGGDRVPEAVGFEAMLTGARERCNDDDALLGHVSLVLDDVYQTFSQQRPARIPTEV